MFYTCEYQNNERREATTSSNKPVEVLDFRINTSSRFRGIYKIDLKLIEKNRKITTCNQLDLEARGF